MTIQVYKLFNKQKINTLDAGARLFNILKTNLETHPEDMELVLDMKDVILFGEIPFKTLVGKMKIGLQGNIQIKLLNHNQYIDQAFRKAI